MDLQEGLARVGASCLIWQIEDRKVVGWHCNRWLNYRLIVNSKSTCFPSLLWWGCTAKVSVLFGLRPLVRGPFGTRAFVRNSSRRTNTSCSCRKDKQGRDPKCALTVVTCLAIGQKQCKGQAQTLNFTVSQGPTVATAPFENTEADYESDGRGWDAHGQILSAGEPLHAMRRILE